MKGKRWLNLPGLLKRKPKKVRIKGKIVEGESRQVPVGFELVKSTAHFERENKRIMEIRKRMLTKHGITGKKAVTAIRYFRLRDAFMNVAET